MKSLALMLLLGFSFAKEVVLYPIPVEIKQRVGYLWVEGKPGQTFQVKTESEDLVAYPPILRLNKDGKGTLRLAFKKTAEDVELFSRVILEEVKPQEEGLNFAYSFSIPVFQPPKKEAVKITVECKDKKLNIKNEGNVHLKITAVEGKERKEMLLYVMPQKEAQVEVDGRGDYKIVTNRSTYLVKCP